MTGTSRRRGALARAKPVPVLWLWGSLVYYLIATPSPTAAAEPDVEGALATGSSIEA